MTTSRLSLLLLTLLLPGNLSAETMRATVVALRGVVTITAAGAAEKKSAVVGTEVPVGSTVETGVSSEVVMKGLAGNTLKLAASGTLTISEMDLNGTKQKTLLDLKNGSLNASLQGLDPNETDFRVKTPLGVAAARGTIFSVFVSQDGKTVRIVVSEGKVGVLNAPGRQEKIELLKGQKIVLRFTDAQGVVYEIGSATFDEILAAEDFGMELPAGFSQAIRGTGGGGVSAEVTPVKNE